MRCRLAILVLVCSSTLLSAETIYLKNGKRIVADSAREKNNRIEYTIGEDTYAIPKALVDRIDGAGAPAAKASHSADLPEFTPNNTVAGTADLSAEVVRGGHLDLDALRTAEQSNNPQKAAAAYFVAARYEQEHGNREQAVTYFRRALDFLPENGPILSHLAAVLVQMGRYGDAIPYAEQAARADGDSVDSLTVLGIAYFMADRTRDAIPIFKRALAIRPDSVIQKMLAKAERELNAEADYTQRETGHFTLRYEGRHISAALGNDILDTLESHYDDLVRELGVTPRSNIAVILYTDEAFEDVTQSPQWTAALNDGKIRIPISGLTAVDSEFSRVLRHELAHSFISQVSRGRCPQWLHEGVAQLVEPRRLGSSGPLLASLYAQEKQVPLNYLEASFMNYSGGQAAIAYAESLAAAEYINETYGMSDLRLILERIGDGMSTEAAMRATIHSGYSQFESELGTYLKDRYGE